MIRPEALATLTRWRSYLIAAGLIALGLWWGTGGGIVAVLGWGMVVLGGILIWTAIQRHRFASTGGDPGVVDVIEGQVSYFGPNGGGFAALSELGEIVLASRGGISVWVLRTPGQEDLLIPTGAAGTEKLFDAFGSLPGLTGATLIAALSDTAAPIPAGQGNVVPFDSAERAKFRKVWSRPPKALQ